MRLALLWSLTGCSRSVQSRTRRLYLTQIQVDHTGILDKRSQDAREKTLHDLTVLYEELSTSSDVQEVEWTRMRELDFQEQLKLRRIQSDRISKLLCQKCENFEQNVGGF